jgi:hypothetical protein
MLELAPVDLRLAISNEGLRYMAIGAKVHFNTGVKGEVSSDGNRRG